MNKKGFSVRFQNMPPVNLAGFLAKQTMTDWQSSSLLASWQSAYWMKHKKSGGEPEVPAAEESADENEAAMAQEPSGVEEAAREEKKQRPDQGESACAFASPPGERGDGLTARELQKAMAMSVILGPPACRKRKRYESTVGRR